MSLQRDREDLLTLEHTVRFFRLNISEERVQGGKAMVPRTGRGLPFFLQVIQEGFDQRNVDLFETQFFRSDSLEVATESQKQSKHVPVCLDGIRAEIPLRGQVMGQETGHVMEKSVGFIVRSSSE